MSEWLVDLEIRGFLSRDSEVQGECVWCGKPSTSRATAPGLGREVPCHIVCCGAIIRAAREWMRTGEPSPSLLEYRRRLGRAPLLESGEMA